MPVVKETTDTFTSQEQLEAVASIVVQQKAMARSLTSLPHGSRMFQVKSGWEAEALKNDPAIISCDSLLSLDAAVKNEDVKVIFMPRGGLITDADIEKIIQRNGATKTLFKEVE